MTTRGFHLCTGCKDRLAAMKREQAHQCQGQRVLGGQCQRRTSHKSRLCPQHRTERTGRLHATWCHRKVNNVQRGGGMSCPCGARQEPPY